MLCDPVPSPWLMRWAGRPAITPPDPVRGPDIALPMVAPNGPDPDQPHTAQEPPQAPAAHAKNNDTSTEHGCATPRDITVDPAALVVIAAGDSVPVLTNAATPQSTATPSTDGMNLPTALMAYKSYGDPGDESDDESNGDLSDPAYRDFILNATESEIDEYDAKHAKNAKTHWSDSFDTYEDFMAAAHGDPGDESDDESSGDLSDPVYRDFILNATEEDVAEYEANLRQTRKQNKKKEIITYADFMEAVNDPHLDDTDDSDEEN